MLKLLVAMRSVFLGALKISSEQQQEEANYN